MPRANAYYRINDYSRAIDEYRAVLQADPSETTALARLADSYRRTNQLDKAATTYRQLLQLNGIPTLHQLRYGLTLMGLARYAEARQVFEQYRSTDESTASAYIASIKIAEDAANTPSIYRVNREYVNTDAADFGATFYKDKVVFASGRKDIKRKSAIESKQPTDLHLYITGLDKNGFLQQPTYLRSELHDRDGRQEGPVAYSGNGRWVAFTVNQYRPGVRHMLFDEGKLDLFIAQVGPSGDWDEAVAFPFNGSAFSTGFPFLNQDGSLLYFASNRPGGKGGMDLYVSQRTGNTWTAPRNLGSMINSPGNEVSPFVDGTDLLFASDYHPGLGGMDVFRAVMDGNSVTGLYNLGTGVNSSFDDYGFVYNHTLDVGYVSSNRSGSQGAADLYRVKRNATSYDLTVLDAKTQDAIAGAVVDFSACGQGTYRTNAVGQYRYLLRGELSCEVTIRQDGYQPYVFKIDEQQSGKQIEISLNRIGTGFVGRLINTRTKAAVRNATIEATDQRSGTILTATTDEEGNYRLPLNVNSRYVLNFSKAGYISNNLLLRTTAQIANDILGTHSIQPRSEAAATPPVAISTPDVGTPVVAPPASTAPTGYDAPTQLPEGFAVQVISISKDSKTLPDFDKLKPIGQVYSVSYKTFNRYRVGNFTTRAAADAARQKVIAAGFSGAFVVQVQAEEVMLERGGTPIATTPQVSATGKPYMVQLAVYNNPKWFDGTKVAQYGTIARYRRSDGKTVMLLAGFETKAAATAAARKADRAGYSSAFVVRMGDEGPVRI